MPTPKPKSGYKTKRKYGCPYCDEKMPRSELVSHVQDEHEMMIPAGYTAARAVYDHINGKNYGTCMCCGCKVYTWDDRIWRYKNLCDKPECLEQVRNKAANNHLDDPEKQKQMLANRKISGQYRFRDGGQRSYVGSYERKTLQFMDRGFNIPSQDIMTPGPEIQYEFEGEMHTWITDILYIPAMLAIDVKDGGSNPNNRPMENYRAKQLAKEKAIAEQGVYNYLRLTDNDFGQLMSAVADIRYGEVVNDPTKGIYIHEAGSPAGNVMVSSRSPGSKRYIIPYMLQNTFDGISRDERYDQPDGYIYGWLESEEDIGFCFENGKMVVGEVNTLLKGKKPVGDQKFRKIVFDKDHGNMAKQAAKRAGQKVPTAKGTKQKKEDLPVAKNELAILEGFIGGPITLLRDAYFIGLPQMTQEEYRIIRETKLNVEWGGFLKNNERSFNESEIVKPIGKHMTIMKDDQGYYVSSQDPHYMLASPYYNEIEQIPQDLVELMDTIYQSNHLMKGKNANGTPLDPSTFSVGQLKWRAEGTPEGDDGQVRPEIRGPLGVGSEKD